MENMEVLTDKCRHYEFCGGCAHQGIDYEIQLRLKNDEVLKQLKDKGILYDAYLGIEGSPDIYGYRNKMEYAFGDMVKGGEMNLGLHQKGKYVSVVTVDDCQLVDQDFNLVLRFVLDYCKEKGYIFYNKKTHSGLLRHLILRKGVRTKELLVNIVTSSQGPFDGREFAERLLKLKLNNSIVGIINTINDGKADFIQCDEMKVLWGNDHYMERIVSLDFKVSAFSFFQTNVAAAERLYLEAISMIDDFSGKTVFDLYCGTGTISQAMARKAKKVTGIELSPEAVASAKENAERNGLSNCEFITGDVLKELEQIDEKPDIIVLDPPRAGVQLKALRKIAGYGVGQIIYISCNPKTLAENLYYLQENGYRVEKIKACDNFPFTRHCECIASLRKKEICNE